jgi:hypothetical protein
MANDQSASMKFPKMAPSSRPTVAAAPGFEARHPSGLPIAAEGCRSSVAMNRFANSPSLSAG